MKVFWKRVGTLLSAVFLAIVFVLGGSVGNAAAGINGSRARGGTMENRLLAALSGTALTAEAADGSSLRRPCSPEKPMLIVHIDTWNYADPAKIIRLIPEDIRPYCVFNVSMSINYDMNTHQWKMVKDGYRLAKSWLRTCADEGVWTMVQPASGGQCHFPDYPADYDFENTLFGEFFRDYPTFIGFNYSEQFWGFQSKDFPVTPMQRYQHFAGLLKLCHKYGGYLDVNFCANYWSAGLNPIAMMKKCPEWKQACERYPENYILEEKYTQRGYIADTESQTLGCYLAGYCGNYGVRYDKTGWSDGDANGGGLESQDQYRQVTELPICMERFAFNGATVIDGPELVWADDFKETWGYNDAEGYHARDWAMYDQFRNVTLDFFRKMIDGTVHIPTRQEVINRTKYFIIQDIGSGNDNAKYCTKSDLFEGLYRMSGDGNLDKNYNPFKSTGRYPTIPTFTGLADKTAQSFKYVLKQSQLSSRWGSIQAKQNEMNREFASEHYGTCYAGRYQNTWVSYNPSKTGQVTGAVINLKYNTCKSLDTKWEAYGSGVIREYSDHIDLYINNFDEQIQKSLRTDIFKIDGCKEQPAVSWKDRGYNQTKSQVSVSYADGSCTITVRHNGPVDLSVKCSGKESGRASDVRYNALQAPAQPPAYTGIRQYEGEFFDQKNIEGIVGNGCTTDVRNYYGQGFLKFGTKGNAAVKDTVRTQAAGKFLLALRYCTPTGHKCVDLWVNGQNTGALALQACANNGDWKEVTREVTLKKGDNKIEFRANAGLPAWLNLDCFTVSGDFIGQAVPTATPVPVPTATSVPVPTAAPMNGKLIRNLRVFDSARAGAWEIYEDFDDDAVLFGDRNIRVSNVPSELRGAEAIRTACDTKALTTDEAVFTAGDDCNVYVAVDSRVCLTDLKPAWLASWKKTDLTLTVFDGSADRTLVVYLMRAAKGTEITLGTNSGYGGCMNYIVLAAKEAKPTVTPKPTATPKPTVTPKPTEKPSGKKVRYENLDLDGSFRP